MNKPKNQTTAKEGTKVYEILNLLLRENISGFKSYADASIYLNDKFQIDVTGDYVYKIVNFYNEGLYIVDGTTSDIRKIELITSSEDNQLDMFSEDEGEYYGLEAQDTNWDNWKRLCEELNVDANNTSYLWDKKSKEVSALVVNPSLKSSLTMVDALRKMAGELNIKKEVWTKPLPNKDPFALKVTLSDEHIGLDPLPKTSLYQYEYNADIYSDKMEKVFQAIMKEYNIHGTFEVLYLDNLGDQQDGWQGKTTRGGHELPQNMDAEEVFQICVKTRLKLIRSILDAGITEKIVLRNAVNDNHSGSFATVVSTALKLFVEELFDEDLVQVDTLYKFLETRTYGDHAFVLTHGKDKEHMFKGLPLVLNDKTENFIRKHLDHYEINSPYIHVEKGDLHQLSYQRCKKFDYRNFGSFAPPSAWVQHNFGDTYSCFATQVIPKYSNEITHTDYFVNYQKTI